MAGAHLHRKVCVMKRYSPEFRDDAYTQMQESATGEYVRYEDVKQLLSDLIGMQANFYAMSIGMKQLADRATELTK